MLGGLIEYVARRQTPVRRLQHAAMQRFAPKLEGKVIELGGFGEGRRAYATHASEYLVTNLTGPNRLDAAEMELPDASVDGFLCESMLEHAEEPERVIAEIHRVLRPGGRLLLLTPWMYPYHAAPDDYLRFSESALRRMLTGFSVLEAVALGNYWTSMATFAQLKVLPWRTTPMPASEFVGRLLVGAPLLAAGVAFLGVARVLRGPDEFAAAYCVLAEKLRR
jgi:SAM-dependent methyltransferase